MRGERRRKKNALSTVSRVRLKAHSRKAADESNRPGRPPNSRRFRPWRVSAVSRAGFGNFFPLQKLLECCAANRIYLPAPATFSFKRIPALHPPVGKLSL